MAKRNGQTLCAECYKKKQNKCMKCFKYITSDDTPVFVGKFLATFHADCFACVACKSKIEDPKRYKCKGNDLYHEKCLMAN